MRRKFPLFVILIILIVLTGCISIYHYVRDKRDSSYTEGVEFYKEGKYKEARDRFETVVEIEPDYRDAKQYLARTERILGQQKKNINRKADANYDRALALMKQGRENGALPLLLQAKEQNPDIDDIDDKIAECRARLVPVFDKLLAHADRQHRKKQYRPAYATSLKAKMYAPSNPRLAIIMRDTADNLEKNAKPYIEKGNALYGKKSYDAALKAYRLALNANPWDENTQTLIDKTNGKINLEKNYRKAVTLFNRREYFGARAVFGQVNGEESSYKDTEQYLAKIQTILNSQIGAFYNNGVTLYDKGNYQGAVNEFNKVLSVNPNHANALEYRSRAQTKLNLQKSVGGKAQ